MPDGTVKDIEDEIPFDVPEGWAWCRLPSICAIPITDGTHQTPTYSDKENGIPFLSSKDVTTQKIDWSKIKYITKELHEELQKRVKPQKNDVLLAKNGTTGVAALVETDEVFDIYVTLALLRPVTQIYPKYLLNLINSPFCKEQFNGHLTGIGVPNLHLNDICKTLIPVPPLREQEYIVSELERIIFLINSLENDKADLQIAIKQAKSKILDLAIHGKLVEQDSADEPASVLLEKLRAEKEAKIKAGELKRDKNDSYIYKSTTDNCHCEKFADGTVKDIEDEIPFDIPNGWAWTKAKCLYNIHSAIRIHQTDWKPSGIPFFRGRELVELCKTGNVHPEIYISEELYEQNKLKGGVPQKDDLLVSAVGTLGYVHIVEGTKKFYYKDAYILCFENKFNLNPKYTKLVIESDYTQKVIYDGSKGTTVEQLTIENAKDLWIPLPPLAEQKRIVEKIENAFAKLDFIAEQLA